MVLLCYAYMSALGAGLEERLLDFEGATYLDLSLGCCVQHSWVLLGTWGVILLAQQ